MRWHSLLVGGLLVSGALLPVAAQGADRAARDGPPALRAELEARNLAWLLEDFRQEHGDYYDADVVGTVTRPGGSEEITLGEAMDEIATTLASAGVLLAARGESGDPPDGDAAGQGKFPLVAPQGSGVIFEQLGGIRTDLCPGAVKSTVLAQNTLNQAGDAFPYAHDGYFTTDLSKYAYYTYAEGMGDPTQLVGPTEEYRLDYHTTLFAGPNFDYACYYFYWCFSFWGWWFCIAWTTFVALVSGIITDDGTDLCVATGTWDVDPEHPEGAIPPVAEDPQGAISCVLGAAEPPEVPEDAIPSIPEDPQDAIPSVPEPPELPEVPEDALPLDEECDVRVQPFNIDMEGCRIDVGDPTQPG